MTIGLTCDDNRASLIAHHSNDGGIERVSRCNFCCE
jgi:hypothetical protein